MTSHASGQQEHVLSTLNADGTRRWMRPRPAPGRWLNRRRMLGYALIALFVTLPHLRIAGKPPILLNIIERQFTFFGTTLYPTDTLLLALLVVSIFLSIFFLTAMFGRVWCGWACPQTVYLELVFRPIERLLEGTPGKKTKTGAWRRPLRIVIYLVLSFFLANTFLSYFVGTNQLYHWVLGSPLKHPLGFFVVMLVTGLMMFDFGFFREQLCIVACPYGRMQSVMLDRDSLIIGYDRTRGEPRGKGKRAAASDVSLKVVGDGAALGDCIDCHMCVTTCPTGIDIRDGLQLECVNCAQCVDACDSIMTKIGKPTGLIRYASQRTLEEGKRRLLRPRVLIYPVIILVLVSAFATVLARRGTAFVSVLRGVGAPYTVLESGLISNPAKIKVHNRDTEPRAYEVTIVGIDGAEVVGESGDLLVEPGQIETAAVRLAVPRDAFKGAVNGRLDIQLRVTDHATYDRVIAHRLVGPLGHMRGAHETHEPSEGTP